MWAAEKQNEHSRPLRQCGDVDERGRVSRAVRYAVQIISTIEIEIIESQSVSSNSGR